MHDCAGARAGQRTRCTAIWSKHVSYGDLCAELHLCTQSSTFLNSLQKFSPTRYDISLPLSVTQLGLPLLASIQISFVQKHTQQKPPRAADLTASPEAMPPPHRHLLAHALLLLAQQTWQLCCLQCWAAGQHIQSWGLSPVAEAQV